MTTDLQTSALAPASSPQIEEAQLDNGLRIVVIPDHRAPIVTHMLWYRNGSADDPAGKSGIAHFLEHLMFKGTANNPAGRFSTLLSGIGGEENAFTSYDYTAYFQRVPREHLALCMSYESDRMKNLVFAEEVVKPERDVVLEERRMRTDSDPGAILNESLLATLFTSHPYGKPIIGWQHEIEDLGKQDAFSYYERFYAPENAILVVAGDVTASEVIEMARDAYGPLAPFGTAPVRRRPREPRPSTHRRVSHADQKVGQPMYQRLHLARSYATAAPGEAEALDVVAALLGMGHTSALFKTLVLRDKIAVSTGAYYAGDRLDEGFFGFYVVPAPGVSLGQVETALDELLLDLARSGFDEADISRAKTRLVADAIYAEDSHTELARRYGAALSNGATLNGIATWPDRIDAVTTEAIQRVFDTLALQHGVSGYLDRPSAAGPNAILQHLD